MFCQSALKLVDKPSSDPVWHPFDVGICLISVGWGALPLEVGPEALLADSGVQSETLVLEIEAD